MWRYADLKNQIDLCEVLSRDSAHGSAKFGKRIVHAGCILIGRFNPDIQFLSVARLVYFITAEAATTRYLT